MIHKTAATKEAPFAAFGELISARLDRLALSNREAARACGVTPEMVRRYRDGLVMPRDHRLRRLALLVGLTASELRYQEAVDNSARAPLLVDEDALLADYRALPEFARKAARARLAELRAQFAVAPGEHGRAFP